MNNLEYYFISAKYPRTDICTIYTGNEEDPGLILGSGRSPGEGNGNSIQYSCLENLMDGGAWQTTICGVSKSQTWVSNFTFLELGPENSRGYLGICLWKKLPTTFCASFWVEQEEAGFFGFWKCSLKAQCYRDLTSFLFGWILSCLKAL